MAHWLAVVLLFCGWASAARADSWFSELTLGISFAELQASAARHGARLLDEATKDHLHVVTFDGRMFGRETLAFALFEDDRARLFYLDFYHWHGPLTSVTLSMEQCRQAFTAVSDAVGVRPELAGTTQERTPNGFGAVHAWRGPHGYACVELGAPRAAECGKIDATLFDGSEAELEAFDRRLGLGLTMLHRESDQSEAYPEFVK
jgi:hypothetical protein